jgi:hypothetical protein
MMSRLVLNLHEAAARTAHESHAMRVMGNVHTHLGEEPELDVLSRNIEPLLMDIDGSSHSGGASRSLRHPWDGRAI